MRFHIKENYKEFVTHVQNSQKNWFDDLSQVTTLKLKCLLCKWVDEQPLWHKIGLRQCPESWQIVSSNCVNVLKHGLQLWKNI